MGERIFNPFQTIRPAVGKSFIGREKELDDVMTNKENYLIFGFSRFGKTSFLQTLERSLKDKGKVVVNLGYSGDSVESFVQNINNALKSVDEHAYSLIKDERSINNVMDILNKNFSPDNKLFLLLDETPHLLNDPSTISTFRAYNNDKPNISFVYAMFPNVFQMIQGHESRFQDAAKMIPLIPFDIDNTKNLVNICKDTDAMRAIASYSSDPDVYDFKAFEVEDGVYEKIYQITGGFPFLVQGLMQRVIDYSIRDRSEVTSQNMDSSYDFLLRDITENSAHLWNSMSPLQRGMVGMLASEEGMSESDLKDQTKELSDSDPSVYLSALNPLSEKGLCIIERKDDGFMVRGTLFKDVFRQFHEFYG